MKKLATILTSAALVVTAAASQWVMAETIEVPVGQQGQANWNVERPNTGMSKDTVLKQYGEPEKRYAPVGDPPITKWEYPDYVVVFEYNTVIRSVLKATPNAQ